MSEDESSAVAVLGKRDNVLPQTIDYLWRIASFYSKNPGKYGFLSADCVEQISLVAEDQSAFKFPNKILQFCPQCKSSLDVFSNGSLKKESTARTLARDRKILAKICRRRAKCIKEYKYERRIQRIARNGYVLYCNICNTAHKLHHKKNKQRPVHRESSDLASILISNQPPNIINVQHSSKKKKRRSTNAGLNLTGISMELPILQETPAKPQISMSSLDELKSKMRILPTSTPERVNSTPSARDSLSAFFNSLK